MKTDRFADSIRRKLDSIRPEFSERDWTKMQAALKQAGPLPGAAPVRPRVFSGQAARLIAAGAAGTVLFLGTTLYQTYEVNRLRKSAQATSQPTTVSTDSGRTITSDTPIADRTAAPSVMPESSPGGQPSAPTIIRDTVYIDRYIRVPARSSERVARAADLAPGQSMDADDSRELAGSERLNAGRQRLATPGQPVGGARAPESVAGVRSGNTGTLSPNQTAGSRLQPPTGDRQYPNSVPMTSPTDLAGTDRSGSRAESAARERGMTGREINRGTTNAASTDVTGNGATSYRTPSSQSAEPTNQPTGGRAESLVAAESRPAGNTSAGGEPTGSSAITVEPMPVQPVQLGAVAWEQRLMQRSRRMRPARTVVVGGPAIATSSEPKAAPEKPDRQSVSSLVRVRVGAGSDLNGKLWSVGGFAELLAWRHVTISVGLSRASFDNGSYLTEDNFRDEKKIDLRREFKIDPRIIDPRRDLLNIQLNTKRVVMPLTVGYRIPVGATLAITPTVGTILNLQSYEQVSFIYKAQVFPPYPTAPNPNPYGTADAQQERSISLFNNMTLGANVEWSKKHWGIQAGPILTIANQPDPTWVSTLSGGVRARAFFQF